jgi:hypothetical protein
MATANRVQRAILVEAFYASVPEKYSYILTPFSAGGQASI